MSRDQAAHAIEPEFRELQETLCGLGYAPAFGRFRHALESLLARMDVARAAAGHLLRHLAALASDPTCESAYSDRQPTEILSCPSGRVFLALGTRGEHPRILVGQASHLLVVVVAGEATVKRYRHSSATDPSIFNSADHPLRLPDVVLRPRHVITAEAWRDIIELDGDRVELHVHSSRVHEVRWTYDRDTAAPLALVPADRDLIRIDDGMDILRHIGTEADASACEALTRHRSHIIRWAAVRTALALNGAHSTELLEAASRDPHPDVRAAARHVAALCCDEAQS